MSTSGWCQVAPGTTHTKRQHDACRGVCGCPQFGGHVGAQIQAVERDSALQGPQFETGKRYAMGKQSGPDQRELIEADRPLVRSDRQ